MTRLSPLLLLATIQQFYVPTVEASLEVTNNCPFTQTIEDRCSHSNVLISIKCSKEKSGKYKLHFKVLSRYCRWSYRFLEIGNVKTGETYKMCKWSCFIYQCSSSHGFLFTIKSAEQQRLVITLENSNCDQSESNMDFWTDLNSTIQGLGDLRQQTGTSLEYFNEKMSWIKALEMCHYWSSTLVEITNQTVSEEVKSLLKNQTALEEGVWIGLERSIFGTNVDWKWTSGFTMVYPQWNKSFPVDHLNNHCGKIMWVKESEQIMLLDADCHENLPFICQDPV